jgi:pilus assembly protein CpaC
VTSLAEPNLTALSGETASFLAGGEFPIPISQSLGAVTIEYKQYGVGLAFTPIVLADGRISMRVRPEVSQLSDAGSVVLNNFKVPALTTRRAETTVELGSGQSFMIAGLLQNSNNNNIEKAPYLGDLPILGALFRSTKFQRQETELVVIVTPYLVRPVSGQLAVPTDGYRAPDDLQRDIGGQSFRGISGVREPTAIPAPAPVAAPGVAPVTGSAAASGGTVAAPGFKL